MYILEDAYKDWDIDFEEWKKPKPFGISGCFRLCDESEFMVQAIESHLPYLDEALLVTQPSKDNTVQLARELAKKHDKVRLIEYPENIYFIDKPEFHTVPDNSIKSFVYLSNYALSQCKYQWVAKTEGDVICLSTFQNIVDRIKAEPDKRTAYGRVILNVAGANVDQVSATNPRNGGADEWVGYNHPDVGKFVKRDKWEVYTGHTECMGWSALHMKRCKQEHLPVWNNEIYVPYTPESVRQTLTNFNRYNGYPGHDNPLGEPCLFEDTAVKTWG